MNRDRRFIIGLLGVGAVVGYLVWTGITQTMVYYLTPSELMSRVDSDPALHQVGFKVSGNVIAGSYQAGEEDFVHRFAVADVDAPGVVLPVEFRHPLPDTFQDDGEVVMEGRLREDRVFEATEVLTKCGSRYEAMPDEYYGGEGAPPGGTVSYGTDADGAASGEEGAGR